MKKNTTTLNSLTVNGATAMITKTPNDLTANGATEMTTTLNQTTANGATEMITKTLNNTTPSYTATDVAREGYIPYRSLEFKNYIVKIYAPVDIEDGMADVDFTTEKTGTYDLVSNQTAGNYFSAADVFSIIRESADFAIKQGADKITWSPSDVKRDRVYKSYAKREGYTVKYTENGYPFIDLNTNPANGATEMTTKTPNTNPANGATEMTTKTPNTNPANGATEMPTKTLNTTTANGATEMTNPAVTPNQTNVDNTNVDNANGVKTMAKEILNIRTSKGKKPMYLKQVSLLDATTISKLLTDEKAFGDYLNAKGMKKPQELKKTLDLVLSFYVTECNQSVNVNEINALDNSPQGVEYTPETPIVTESNIVETFEEEVIDMVDYEYVEVPMGYEDEGYTLLEYQEFINTAFDADVEPELPATLEEMKGLVKANFSPAQLEEQSVYSFASKVIAYARVLYQIIQSAGHDEYAQGTSPWSPVLYTLKTFVNNDLLSKQGPNALTTKAYEYMVNNNELGNPYFKALAYLTGNDVSQPLNGIGYEFLNRNFNHSTNIFPRKPAYLTNGIAISVGTNSKLATQWGVKNATDINITSENFSNEHLYAMTRIIFIKDNQVAKYKNANATTELDHVAKDMSLFSVIYLINVLRIDMKTLLNSPINTIIVEVDNKNVPKISVKPTKAIIEGGLSNFFGPSNPDTIVKGIMKLNKSYEGFGEYFVVNGQSYYRSFESVSKVVARTMKLEKESNHQMMLGRVYVVTDAMGNEKAIKALSTGIVHVPTKVLETHGQVRAVSSADRGGFKCTLGPVALMNKHWDKEGISLASFGSMKAEGYGLARLLGISVDEYHNEISKYTKVVKLWGKPVEVVEVNNVVLDITSHYTVNMFESTNRNKLVMSLEEANANVLKRAEERASTIKEDSVFVDYVLSQRDTMFDGSLMNTIKALLKNGTIRAKNKKVSVTPSEFDVLATTHGPQKAQEWLDSLLAENMDDSKKRKEMFIATRIASGTQHKDTKYIREVSAEWFFRELTIIMKANNISVNSKVPSFASRNFLVDVATRLFSDTNADGSKALWVKIVNNNGEVYLPTGDFMYGNFAENSTIYEHKVQVTGFLSGFFKVATYMTEFVSQNSVDELANNYKFKNIFVRFILNVTNELQGYALGKKVGKLKATGLSAVLSVAWWSNDIDSVVYLGKHRFNTKDKQPVLVKHPELFMESITGVNVKGMLPKNIANGLDQDTLKVLSFAFQNTVFVSEEIALSLQNDADGDLVRLTWHKDFTLDNFKNLVTNNTWFANKFHVNYIAKERDFTKGCKDKIVFKTYTSVEVLEAVEKASKSKEGVASYTSLAQRFARFADLQNVDRTSDKVRYTHLLLNTAVQIFSMNEIKQTNNNAKGQRNLMDYFLLKDFDVKERINYAPLFFQFLEHIGCVGNALVSTGFNSREEWLQYIESALTAMRVTFITEKSDDAGFLVVGKDFIIAHEFARKVSILDVLNSNTVYSRIVKAFLHDFNTCAKEGRDFFSTPAKENKAPEEISEEAVVSVDSGLVSTLDTTLESSIESSIPSEMINDDFSVIESSIE